MFGFTEQVVFSIDCCGNAESLNLAGLPPSTLVLQSGGMKPDRYEFIVLDSVNRMAYAGNQRSSIGFDELVRRMR